jgi:hypothetical protein
MEDVGIYYGHLVLLKAIWLFGVFVHILVFCTHKNLATLLLSSNHTRVENES